MASETSDETGAREDTTQVSSSIIEKNNENRDLAFCIYKEVWDEFNRWKVEDCRQQLRLLQKPLPPPNVTEAARIMASAFRTGDPHDVETVYICDTDDDVPLNPGGATVLTCKNVLLKFQEPVTEPHPRYEFCTPSVQSIALRIESQSLASDELEIALFVPYADDPTFNALEHLGQFTFFAWENIADPDVEVIQFEVLRRLHFGHGLSLDDINAANVLPALRSTNRDGLIYKMTQRDELFWAGMMAEFPANPSGTQRRRIDTRAHEPDIDDLRKRVESIVPYFCANPGCVQALCPYHPRLNPSVPSAVPRVASDKYPKGLSCGSMCFREINSTFEGDSIAWWDSKEEELRCILDIIPDTIPCGLAKLVRMPCREVFVLRCRFISNDEVYPESRPSKKTSEVYRDENEGCMPDTYVPPDPCSHRGPCDINTPGCICAKESVHCTRKCHCSTTCERYWRGCRCRRREDSSKTKTKTKTKTCTIEYDCPCRRRGWECDPMVCECDNPARVLGDKLSWTAVRKRTGKKRRVIRPDGQHYCQNSDMQRGIPAKLEIKRGAYGLGAFAVDPILQDQFIGEYIGELLPTTFDEREIMRIHLGLNYSFTLNENWHIDSARVGNETRYINHGAGDKANAVAIKKLVLGDIRIAFYSTRRIKANAEILFDYGKDYWKKTQNEGEGEGDGKDDGEGEGESESGGEDEDESEDESESESENE